MISAAAAIHHSPFNWDWLWGLLSGLGGVAAVITLLLTLPTYVSNLRTPFKVTSANYRVGADNSMAITITVKNRQSNDRSLTGLIIGQPPNRWKRLRPKWWVGLVGSKLFDIDFDITKLGAITSGDSRTFNSLPLKREEGTGGGDTLPSNARVLAYSGADRPYVKRPKRIDGSPSTASTPPPKDTAAPVKNGPEPPEGVTPDLPAS
jgi:hypothetical protein